VFWPALAVWAWLLVKPNPVPEAIGHWDSFLKFLVAKSLHAGVYAGLTVLAVIGSPARRWGVVLLMGSHAMLTELGQYYGNRWFGTGRGGCVRDVLIDWAGVAGGHAIWWIGRRYCTNTRTEAEDEKETDRESRSGQAG
jgi:VanZ family protein